MQDEQIVELYWQREESAIAETEVKYGRYLTKIAYNILADVEDSRESVNDTYLGAWNSMPPHRPAMLSTYLGKITRRISIDRFRGRNREKRRPSQYAVSLAELEECISQGNVTEEAVERFVDAVNKAPFLLTGDVPLEEGERNLYDREIYHMFFEMKNGMTVHMRLYEGGYVRFHGLIPACVKVEEEVFEEMMAVMEP